MLAAFFTASMHGIDQIAHGPMGFKFVTQLCSLQYAVAIAPTFALALDHAASFEFCENFQDGAFSDADL